ncbi:hypothetical protein [Micromonospora cremea]|uniref:LPXTG-motif cell wall anchor domain-containing protein n=1 Tax=Micromonospora cremea TaxID=709881 RepID=A0A1N6AKZ8_9ACTN|nr:hypothetical protein [Micromonospora cremea]SIN34681.1 hypothetical protein SAMN04489832_5707 [Micromonospora cremea]
MTVRRRAARLATVCGLVGALVMLGASPALADDDSVRVDAAGSFAAGGSPQGVNVAVRKRSDGCVLLRTALNLRLSGLQPDQVTVHVNAGGRWFPVPVSGGGGSAVTAQTSPAKPTLCKGKGITVRYRVAFAAGAPAGRLAVTGVALSATGHELGRGSDSSKLTSRASASPTPTPSKKPSPTPSVTTEAAPAGDAVNEAALGGAPDTKATAAESSGGSPVMFFGIAMVAVGLLLIVLLFRRSRQDRKPADELSGPLPGNPGGTTYRSGGGSPAVPGAPGPVYGQQQASGGYGAVPTPRPATGGVYGARPAVPPSPPDATQAMPGTPGAPGGRPGPDDPPAAAGGDHTVFMPRLPG